MTRCRWKARRRWRMWPSRQLKSYNRFCSADEVFVRTSLHLPLPSEMIRWITNRFGQGAWYDLHAIFHTRIRDFTALSKTVTILHTFFDIFDSSRPMFVPKVNTTHSKQKYGTGLHVFMLRNTTTWQRETGKQGGWRHEDAEEAREFKTSRWTEFLSVFSSGHFWHGYKWILYYVHLMIERGPLWSMLQLCNLVGHSVVDWKCGTDYR